MESTEPIVSLFQQLKEKEKLVSKLVEETNDNIKKLQETERKLREAIENQQREIKKHDEATTQLKVIRTTHNT